MFFLHKLIYEEKITEMGDVFENEKSNKELYFFQETWQILV